MCGIFGFLPEHKSSEECGQLLDNMGKLLAHRGPDSEGKYVDENIALGHTRLSIIDLNTGDQPMQDWQERYVIAFNGEIYNFLELRDQLIKKGFRFLTHSDTEVIIAAYHFYNDECVKYLNGMFSFALWDKKHQKLFLARDRLGKKPLYYFHNGEQFVFASELKAILMMQNVPRELDMAALNLYFTLGYIPAPWTIFKNISKIQEASYLVFKNGYCEEKKYWDLPNPQPVFSRSEDDYAEELESLLLDAVRCRMISDVPLGAFLSGGIDSSAIVAMMAKQNSQPVQTFTIDFAEKTFSELEEAHKVSKHCHTDHKVLKVNTDAIQLLPKLVWHFDEPFADSSAIPTYYVSKMAREHVTVILSGDGGDELFAGYNSYQKRNQYDYLIRLPRALRKMIFGELAQVIPINAPMRNLLKYVASASVEDGPEVLGFFPYIREDVLSSSLIRQLNKNNVGDHIQQLIAKYHFSDKLTRLQYIDKKLYLPGDILVKVDRMSMGNSLETRAPLLDYRVVEFASQLPVNLKMKNGTSKYLLKKMLKKYVPLEILTKPKHGFAVPVNQWFKTTLNGYTQDVLLDKKCRERGLFKTDVVEKVLKYHKQGKRDYSGWIYMLLMLEMWFQTFMDSSSRRI